MDGNREEALSNLIELSQRQGYITFDDIIESSENFGLPIQDVDWLSNSITTKGIIIYDEKPSMSRMSEDGEFDDFAHGDYETIFDRVISLDETLEPFINEARSIIPPQYREIAQLKYQVVEGNRHARNRMIEMHLRMAEKIALQRTEVLDLDIADSISCACLGLINAVDKYDPDKLGAFGSYAALWMQQLLGRESPTKRPLIYYPVHKKEGYYTMYPMIKERGCLECEDIGQCRKLLDMICNKLGCTNEQAEDVIEACIPLESLDLFLENIDEYEKRQEECEVEVPKDLVARDDLFEMVAGDLLKDYVVDLLGDLKDREREILIARYGLGGTEEKTLEEVGGMYGVTRERIRQIEAKALGKLRNPIRLKKLKDFL
ncbi:sigma-70 family RNA polymerase sigma factor [Phosphitispora sp. TUW77]|uniref:sigma-70 family RNA polymerase sigma factor n=1 Tax=Phosphitispora sp. TUW77 TaxID=3152361 RepID=UPI003AB73D63